jgi:hypothetical protein
MPHRKGDQLSLSPVTAWKSHNVYIVKKVFPFTCLVKIPNLSSVTSEPASLHFRTVRLPRAGGKTWTIVGFMMYLLFSLLHHFYAISFLCKYQEMPYYQCRKSVLDDPQV